MPRACLGLGSNLGDREAMLRRALDTLAAHPAIVVVQVSSFHETDPVGGPPQGRFLNAAAVLDTTLAPEALLEVMLATEGTLGRVRAVRHGPRTIDLDLLLYEEEVRHDEHLELPHPEMTRRSFVLEPLAEIAGEWVVPGTRRTVRAHLEALP